MKQTTDKRSNRVGSVLFAAICGGILVITFTKVIPTLLAKMMSGMMAMMKSKMQACGCNPREMCQLMMTACPNTPQEGS